MFNVCRVFHRYKNLDELHLEDIGEFILTRRIKFKELKTLVSVLLTGDVTLTENNDELLMLLRYGYERISNEADALKLFTTENPSERIVRNGPGGLFVRMPKTPEYEEDELDLDEELCFAVARYMCSFVSTGKPQIHTAEATKIINSYNQKVQTFFETLERNENLKNGITVSGDIDSPRYESTVDPYTNVYKG